MPVNLFISRSPRYCNGGRNSMFILSNSVLVNIVLFIGNTFCRIIPYKYTVALRRFYKFNLNLCKGFYKTLKYKNTDIFTSLVVETTTYCNRRCTYCPNSIFERSTKKNESLMPEKMFKKIIDELKGINYKGKIFPFLYGEPLLDRRLPDLIGYAHKTLPEAKIVIYTNGDFLDIDKTDELYKCGVSYFVITLHTYTKSNIDKVKRLITHIKKTGKKLKVLCQVLDKHTALSARTGLVKVENKKEEDLTCLDPIVINYRGDVLICCHDYLGVSSMGNVREEKLIDIWNKSDFMRIRNQLRNRKYSLDICNSCVAVQKKD